jgi:hypothetical protein
MGMKTSTERMVVTLKPTVIARHPTALLRFMLGVALKHNDATLVSAIRAAMRIQAHAQ